MFSHQMLRASPVTQTPGVAICVIVLHIEICVIGSFRRARLTTNLVEQEVQDPILHDSKSLR